MMSTALDEGREARERARHEAWVRQQPALQRLALGWLRESADVTQPWQILLDRKEKGGRPPEAEVLPDRKGHTLHLPSEADWTLRQRERDLLMPVADPGWRAPLAAQDHYRDLQRKAGRLFRAAADVERRGAEVLARVGSEIGPPTAVAAVVKAWASGLRMLASAWKQIRGGYYVKHPPAPGNKDGTLHLKRPEKNCRETWQQRRGWCDLLDEHEWHWAVLEVLAASKEAKGTPAACPALISNFYLEPLFALQKPDGSRSWMLNIHNVHGEVFGFDWRHPMGPENRPLELDGEHGKSPTQMREWLVQRANGTWDAGEREWGMVTTDINALLAHNTVWAVTEWGWHEASQAWWFGDCVMPDGAAPMKPERHGYYKMRHLPGQRKFMMSDRDREGREWVLMHGRDNMLPTMHPEVATVSRTEAAALVTELSDRLFNYVGGPDALMFLGQLAAYAARPDLVREYRSFGGGVVHGEAGKGKGTLVGYGIAMWGYRIFTGKLPAVNIQSGSIPALENALAQMSCLPFVLDEFQKDLSGKVAAIMKAAYDGSKIPKLISADVSGRVPQTTPIVVGQSTSSDAAARSRYVHVGVNEKRRRDPDGQNYQRLNELSRETWRIMRHVLEHRAGYVERVLGLVREWLRDDATQVRETRARMVHGVAYAGYAALLGLLGMPTGVLPELRRWIIAESARAAGEMQEQIEITKVWELVEQCVTLGGFTRPGESEAESLRRIFHAFPVPVEAGSQELTAAHPPGAPGQPGAWEPTGSSLVWRRVRHEAQANAREILPSRKVWVRFRLRVDYRAMFAALEQFARQRGGTVPLTAMDAARQMEGKPWFVPREKVGEKGGKERQYFPGGGGGRSFWELDLDQFEGLGYRPTPDEEVARWAGEGLKEGEKSGLELGQPDPRLGPLYLIVDKLLARPAA